jgi:hypothetical protein
MKNDIYISNVYKYMQLINVMCRKKMENEKLKIENEK